MSVNVADNPGTALIRNQIVRILRAFPGITKSMLSAHVGSYGGTYGINWLDIYDEMVDQGIITTGSKQIDSRALVVLYLDPDKANRLN